MKSINKKIIALSALPAAMAVSIPAHAAIDMTPITGAFTSSEVTTGVMAVGAVLAVIYVSIKAAKIVLGMIRGG